MARDTHERVFCQISSPARSISYVRIERLCPRYSSTTHNAFQGIRLRQQRGRNSGGIHRRDSARRPAAKDSAPSLPWICLPHYQVRQKRHPCYRSSLPVLVDEECMSIGCRMQKGVSVPFVYSELKFVACTRYIGILSSMKSRECLFRP